jgi:hypothetical protein
LGQLAAEISAATRAPNAVPAVAASHKKQMIAVKDIGAIREPSAGERRQTSDRYFRAN